MGSLIDMLKELAEALFPQTPDRVAIPVEKNKRRYTLRPGGDTRK